MLNKKIFRMVSTGVCTAIFFRRTASKKMSRFFKKSYSRKGGFLVMLKKHPSNPFPEELYKFETGDEVYLGCKRIQ